MCEEKDIIYGWGNTNPSGFYSVVLQITQDVVFHFRSLECSSCSLLLHLLMQRTFINQTCVNGASRRGTIKDRGWFSWFPGISQNFCGRERNKNTALHGRFFVCWFFFSFVDLIMIIMRLLSPASVLFSLFCLCSKCYNSAGLSCALNESGPVGGDGNRTPSRVVTHMQCELSCWNRPHSCTQTLQHLMEQLQCSLYSVFLCSYLKYEMVLTGRLIRRKLPSCSAMSASLYNM